ncbi:TPA: Gfo/Idh/MocA family oxidoreductase [Candidatus Poribacteria bacterium]|nr:Gfo/Idh/MocA family oxidoreductase [Candidatus Poribacteria bacterium]
MMKDRNEYGIGLIGLGIGQQHLLGYQANGLRVAALCDVDETLLTETADKFGIQQRYTDVNGLVADPDVDIVDIAIQPWLRWPLVKAAAMASKHILCQKPFSMNLCQAVAMVKVCEKYGVELRVNQNSCFVPGFLAIEPYLSDKYLGTIYYASIICDGWFLNFPEKHIIPAMMVHHIGLIYKWFGKFKQVYCQAHGHNRSIDQGETMAVTQFTTESDIQGLLSCNWASSGRAGHKHPHPHEEIRIQGTRGSIYGNSREMVVHVEGKNDEIRPRIEETWFPNAFGNTMSHFMDCLRDGKKPLTNGRENLHVVQVIFAMFQSAKTGRCVHIDEISLHDDYDLSPAPVIGATDGFAH